MNPQAARGKPRENRPAAGLGQVSRHTAVVLLASYKVTIRIIKMAFGGLAKRKPSGALSRQRKIKLVRFAENYTRKVRDRMPWRRFLPTRPEQLAEVLSDPGSAISIAKEFRRAPQLPGTYGGSEPAVSRDPLDLAVLKALSREIDLQGSGPIRLGRPINWHMDHISGYVWPRVHYSRLVPVDPGTGADCRFPWSVGRCQHWLHLAAARGQWQAATAEMLSQFREFTLSNPPGVGVTYASTMEVAIRSVNWLTAFRRSADRYINRDIEHLCVEMAASGRMLRERLQETDSKAGTHEYVVSLLGLYVISTMFPSLANAGDWYRFSGEQLNRELDRQFDGDGGHIEGSPAYATLVLECYLFAYLLGREATDPRVSEWSGSLQRALDHLATIILPNGELPRLGDDDGGRLLSPPGEPDNDARYVLQIGSVVFERADWKARAGCDPRPGLDFWLGPECVQRYRELRGVPDSPTLRVYKQAGFAISRMREAYLLLQGGRCEEEAPRGHLHNDLTSLEYFADGERWLIDPGTYQGYRQPVWRNRFRSTSAHNVIHLNDTEQNQLRSSELSPLPRDVDPLPIAMDKDRIVVGYGRTTAGANEVVTRYVEPSADTRLVKVIDRIDGEGIHLVTLGLNLARRPFSWLAPGLLSFRGEQGYFLLYLPPENGFATTVGDGWYSPHFGVRRRCFRVTSQVAATLPIEVHWQFSAVPMGEDLEMWIRSLEIDSRVTESIHKASPPATRQVS
jgi:hypothetical protein